MTLRLLTLSIMATLRSPGLSLPTTLTLCPTWSSSRPRFPEVRRIITSSLPPNREPGPDMAMLTAQW